MRRDEAKDEVRGGLLWPAGLLVNETTLAQHADRIAGLRMRMTHQLARDCGYAEAEISDVLGPEGGRVGPIVDAIDRDALKASMALICGALDALFDANPVLREFPDQVAAAIERVVWDRAIPAAENGS